MVEKRPNQDFGAWELKSLFVFSICSGWSNDRYHLLLPQRLSSGPAVWTCNARLQKGSSGTSCLRSLCLQRITGRAGGFTCNRNKPRQVARSPGLHEQLGLLLWALQCLLGMTNPPLILADVVITGHKRFDDKQHGDEQTACNTATRRPGKSVWIPYRKRRFQNQRNQGGKSWDVCREHWLARHPTAACPATIGRCILSMARTRAHAEWKAWKSLALGEAGVQHSCTLLPSLKLKTVCEIKKQLYNIL